MVNGRLRQEGGKGGSKEIFTEPAHRKGSVCNLRDGRDAIRASGQARILGGQAPSALRIPKAVCMQSWGKSISETASPFRESLCLLTCLFKDGFCWLFLNGKGPPVPEGPQEGL